MLIFDPIKQELPGLRDRLTEVGKALKLTEIRQQIEEMTQKTMEEGFWDDPEKAQGLLKKKSALENKVNRYGEIEKSLTDVEELMLLTEEENIREVIAFPMNSNAQDVLLGSPGEVTEQQLREVHIKLR